MVDAAGSGFRAHDLARPLDWREDARFDAAILALVIHHIDDRVAVLRELHRLLKPGGVLVVSTHHPTPRWRRTTPTTTPS